LGYEYFVFHSILEEEEAVSLFKEVYFDVNIEEQIDSSKYFPDDAEAGGFS